MIYVDAHHRPSTTRIFICLKPKMVDQWVYLYAATSMRDVTSWRVHLLGGCLSRVYSGRFANVTGETCTLMLHLRPRDLSIWDVETWSWSGELACCSDGVPWNQGQSFLDPDWRHVWRERALLKFEFLVFRCMTSPDYPDQAKHVC